MQIIKPLQLSAIIRSFTYQRQHFCSIGSLLGFDLTTGEPVLEQNLWEKVAATPEVQILDAGFPKPQAEVLVYGCAETPKSEPRTELSASLTVGNLNKQLYLQGKGCWRGLPGFKQQKVDQTFTRIPLSHDYAFGGEGFADNPKGKGFQAITTEAGESLYPLTQVQLLNTPAQKPGQILPLAFTGAMDFMSPQRQQYAGTYNSTYMQKAMPGLPDDFDWLFCQDALPDQRFQEASLPSNAPYKLQNLNADAPLIEGNLPSWQAVAWLLQQQTDKLKPTPQQVLLKAETLILLPNQNLGIMLYRGKIKVNRDDARDIKALLLALEDPKAIKPDTHYLDQLQKRSDQDNAWRYLLDTQPLLPTQITCGMALMMAQNGEAPSLDLPQIDKAQHLAEEIKANARQQIETESLNLPKTGADLPSIAELETPPEWQAKLEALQNKILPKKPNGSPDLAKIDFDAMKEISPLVEGIQAQETAKAQQTLLPQLEAMLATPELKDHHPKIRNKIALLSNPPKPSWPRLEIDVTLNNLVDQLEKEALELKNTALSQEQLKETQQKLAASINKVEEAKLQLATLPAKVKATYRMGAEYSERGSPLLSSKERLKLRQQVLSAIALKQPLPTDDLADLDLSNQLLDGVDFSECYMEGINLSGSSLKGANLKGAIMVYADLQKTDFSNTDLTGANIGSSNLEACIFKSALLTEVSFNKATLVGNDFTQADLVKTQWMQASIKGCNFFQANLMQINLIDPTFEACNFTEANLSQSSLVNPIFSDCKFDSLNAESSNFINMQATASSFTKAKLNNARFIAGCQLDDSNFSQAQLYMASFREASLVNSCFDAAHLEQADLEFANLTSAILKKANLHRANMANTNFTQAKLEDANLMEGILYHAQVKNADFRGANLYAANLLYMELGNTKFDFANLDRTLLQDWRP